MARTYRAPSLTTYARWVRKRSWTELEAALLLSAISPDEFEPGTGSYELGDSPLFKYVKSGHTYPDDVLDWLWLIAVARRRKEIVEGRVAPTTWIVWAEDLGVGAVPSKLLEAIRAMQKSKPTATPSEIAGRPAKPKVHPPNETLASPTDFPEKTLTTKERRSRAKVILALIHLAKFAPLHPYAAAKSIENQALQLKVPISVNTIAGIIEEAFDLQN